MKYTSNPLIFIFPSTFLATECTSVYILGCKGKHVNAWNYRHPRPKVNLLVHFWAASLQANWLLFRTSGIRAASATLRINLCAARSSCTLSVSLLKIACPEVYIRVHFWTRVFALQKHRCCGIHGHPCPFCRYKAQAQINRRHGKKCTSWTFFTYVFAAQTRCCVEPPPSMAVLLR